VGTHPPRLPDPTAEAVEPLGHSRRGFLARVAVGGAVLAVGSQVVPTGGLLPLGAQEDDTVALDADETTLQHLASIALAAAAAHRAGAEVAGIQETNVEVIRSFGDHHRRQAAALNGLIPEEALVEVPNETLLSEVTAALEGADEVAALAALKDMTEKIAATHLAALESVEDQNDARTIAAALGTVSQHAVVLGVLGGESVEAASPETQSTDGALTPSAYPVTFAEEEDAAADGEVPSQGDSSTTTTAGDDADATTTTTEG
jgi:hypothetical protein